MYGTSSSLVPVLPVMAFPVLWLMICWLISLGAWAPLAHFFPVEARAVAEPEQTFHLQSAMLKRDGQMNVSYNNVLTFGLSHTGLRLKVFFRSDFSIRRYSFPGRLLHQ